MGGRGLGSEGEARECSRKSLSLAHRFATHADGKSKDGKRPTRFLFHLQQLVSVSAWEHENFTHSPADEIIMKRKQCKGGGVGGR